MSIAIKIENLSKQYRLGLVSTRTLSHDLNRWWQTSILRREDPYLKIGETNIRETKGESEYVWALKDINLEIEEGEVLGIIGKNGAGKSTLLKILSKVTSPTTGTIKARGRIASLLEVGTGFHQEMTGRENIFLNGAILGMTKAEISKKLDEIIDFSGVERYIDTPVKRYSSGMLVRLGFAVAAHLDPEILIVDEVLAVGDAEFQNKAIGKMQSISKGYGRAVLFVSHNMGAVRSLCKKGIVLNNGTILYEGDIDSSVTNYLNLDAKESVYTANKQSDIYIRKAFTVRNNLEATISFDVRENPCLLVELVNKVIPERVSCAILGIVLLDDTKSKVFTVEYELNEANCFQNTKSLNLLVDFPELHLAPGSYSFLIAIHNPNVELFDEVNDICLFRITEDGNVGHYKYSGVKQGSVLVSANWHKL